MTLAYHIQHQRIREITMRALLLTMMGIVVLALIACGSDESSEESSVAEAAANAAYNPAPAISGDTFEHGLFSLEQHEGKPVVINFWFPSCPPCRAEMPDLQASYEQYGDQVAFLGVQQLGVDSAANGEAFVRELGLTYPNLPDVESKIQLNYEIFSYPATIFLDKDHNLARTWTGIIGQKQIAEQLDVLLAG